MDAPLKGGRCQQCRRHPGWRRLCRGCQDLVGPCCEKMRFSNRLVHCKRCPDPAQWAAGRSWEAGLTSAAASSSLVASPPQCAAAARLLLDFLAASYTHEHIVLGNIYAVVAWVASLRRIRTASTSTRRVLWHHRSMWLSYLRRSVLGYAC